RRQMPLAHLPADRQPIHARQHPVEDDEVRRRLLYQLQRAGAVERLMNRVPLCLQMRAHEVVQVHLILDYQYRRHDPPSISLTHALVCPSRTSLQPLLCEGRGARSAATLSPMAPPSLRGKDAWGGYPDYRLYAVGLVVGAPSGAIGKVTRKRL